MTAKHIRITAKEACCGCNACHEICPKGCIEMRPDSLGLLYPHVDTATCNRCGLCVSTCPFSSPVSSFPPQECYAAINQNESERMSSSSGGVFVELARQILNHGGVVFGAVFAKDWSVAHTYAETMEEVLPMMGSKYVQSDTRRTFGQAKHFLEEGREVLYTGTPCQIAGLKHFLHKNYPGLLTVEVICHGAPAPGVWQSYLGELLTLAHGTTGKNIFSQPLNATAEISGISFRNKKSGWQRYYFSLQTSDSSRVGQDSHSLSLNTKDTFYEPFTKNRYMSAFLRDWSLRPSCYACKTKGDASQADITIGDFWGAGCPTSIGNDDKGVSCVICHTEKGCRSISDSSLAVVPVSYNDILCGNPSLETSASLTYSAKHFQKLLSRRGFSETMHRIEFPSLPLKANTFLFRVYSYLKRRIRPLLI